MPKGFPKMELVGDVRTRTYDIEFDEMERWWKEDRELSEFTGEDNPILNQQEVLEFLKGIDLPEAGWELTSLDVYPFGWHLEYSQNILERNN